MPRRQEEEEPYEEPQRPTPYKLDLMMEQAYAPLPMEALPVESCLVIENPVDAQNQPSGAREGFSEEVSQSLAIRIAALPMVWMRAYITELFQAGGISAIARRAIAPRLGGVSPSSITKARAESELFNELCREAEVDGFGQVDAALFRAATIGDVAPVHQAGMLVGYKRVRDTKAAELIFKRQGLMAPEQVSVTQSGKVEVVHSGNIAARVASVASKLFGGSAPVLEAEVVEPAPTTG